MFTSGYDRPAPSVHSPVPGAAMRPSLALRLGAFISLGAKAVRQGR
jgi:hypothetical protein